GPKGDYVDLLALMDVLAVPVTCGSGDIGQISNFGFKPIQVQVFEASVDTRLITDDHLKRFTGFKSQRAREDFRVKEIRSERELRPTPGYEPKFRAFPLIYTETRVDFTDDEYQAISGLVGRIGKTDAEVVRAAFLLWYQSNRMKPHWIRP